MSDNKSIIPPDINTDGLCELIMYLDTAADEAEKYHPKYSFKKRFNAVKYRLVKIAKRHCE